MPVGWIIAVWLLAIGVLARLVYKGKRVGDDPHCPKCNFNLVGVATQSVEPDHKLNTATEKWRANPTRECLTCTDCGALHRDPGHLPLGERRPRPHSLAGLVALIVIPLAVATGFGYRTGWTFDVYRLLPTQVLIDGSFLKNSLNSQDSQAELLKRWNAPGVSQSTKKRIAVGVVDGLLQRTWPEEVYVQNGLLDKLAMNAMMSGFIESVQTKELTRQALSVWTPDFAVPKGANVPLLLISTQPGTLNEALLDAGLEPIRYRERQALPVTVLELHIDGQQVEFEPFTTDELSGFGSTRTQYRHDGTSPLPELDLEPGEYELTWNLKVGPYRPVSGLTLPEIADIVGTPEAWTVTRKSRLYVDSASLVPKPSALAVPNKPVKLFRELELSPPHLRVGIVDTIGLDLQPNESVALTFQARWGNESVTLCHWVVQRPEVGSDRTRHTYLLYGENVDRISEAHQNGVRVELVVTATSGAAIHAMPDQQNVNWLQVSRNRPAYPRLRVPDREIIYTLNDQMEFEWVGLGNPTPLALELGFIDPDTGEPRSTPDSP